MDKQDVFNALSDLEEYFYYKMVNPGDMPFGDLSDMHGDIEALLRKWSALTGCKNQ